MAWKAIVSSPDVARKNKHQIVETEHLMKALLEQKNGLARRIFSKLGVDNTRFLEATNKFIQRQPKLHIPKKGDDKTLENFIPKSESDFMEYAELISHKLCPYEVGRKSSSMSTNQTMIWLLMLTMMSMITTLCDSFWAKAIFFKCLQYGSCGYSSNVYVDPAALFDLNFRFSSNFWKNLVV